MLRRIIPWLVLLLSSGCGGPRPFVTLAGSFREEGSAARRLGRTMPREDGAFPGPYRAFVVQGAAAEAIDGTYRNVRQIEAAVRAVVRAQINAQCGLDVTPAAGYNEARSIEIEWESVLDTTSDQWQFPQGGCCNDDGSVASQCRDQSVIVAIFRTRVTAHLAQRGGFSANGQFVCMQGTTAQAPVSETGSTAPQEPTAATDPTSASDVGPSEPSSSEDDPTSPPARQPAETSMTPEALRASDQAEGRLTIDVRLTASNELDLSSRGWNVVMVDTAANICQAARGRIVRVAPAEEAALARGAIESLSEALLATYQCRWMFVGRDVLNEACDGVPCRGSEQVTRLYSRSIESFMSDSATRDVLCNAIRDGLNAYGAGSNGDELDCTAQSPWVRQAAGLRIAELQRPEAMPQQVALLRELFARRLNGATRAQVVGAVLQEWSAAAGNPPAFTSAERLWTEFQRRCGQAPCRLPFRDGEIDSRMSWADVRALAFSHWLDFFAIDRGVRPAGCQAALRWRENSWQYVPGRPCSRSDPEECLSFRPGGDVAGPSRDFAGFLVGAGLTASRMGN